MGDVQVLYLVCEGDGFYVVEDRVKAFDMAAGLADSYRSDNKEELLGDIVMKEYFITSDRIRKVIDFVGDNSLAYAGTDDPAFDAEEWLRPALYDPQNASTSQIAAFYDGLQKRIKPDKFWVSKEEAERIWSTMPDFPPGQDVLGIRKHLETVALAYD